MAHIIKKGPIKVPTQPKDFDLQATGLVFKSYDNQIALEFNVTQQDGAPADLLGATLRLLMYVYDEADGTVTKEPVPFITKNLITESFLNGHVKYILPEALKAYSGVVETYVYIEYPDGSTSDNLGFTFRMKRSAIDGLAQDKADYFIEDFKQLLDGVKQEATDAVNEALAKVEVVSENVSSAQNDLTILEDRIDQANQEIGDIVKLRTDIDTLETEKADKTFVDAQLAQKVKKDELVVNVKDYGAKGDGVTNDTQAIQNALDTGKKVFIPKGTYMVSNLIPKGGQVIFGENAVDSWGTSIETSKTILKGMGGATDYVIKNRTWDTDGNPYPVVIQELTIDGNTKTTNGIRCGNSTTIERCRIINCIDGIVKVDVSRVTNCQIVNNTNGIREATDSKIDSNFIYQNDIGIYLINSNDNMVSSNKIEWNGVGIDISTSVFNLITGNIIDRQTTFGITSDSTSYITVTNNQFERNLTNHVLIQGSYWNVTGNSFYKKNSEDDMSGTLVPVSAIELKSASNCTFSANMVFGNKMFSSSYEYVSSNTFSNNAINGGSEVIKVSIPATTLAVGESKTLQIAFPVNYGTTSGWDVEVKKYKLATDSMTNYYQYNGVEIYIHNNNGVYVKLTNNFSTEKTFSGTIWLDHITWSKR
ncbi:MULTISPECIES: right-handed parallel beta-helix repeat-containing protein [Enterococcus]|uniref:right-handed parallel beta-helix repeat-containing protein n=1 Tax=Enterococcus TaxID=1350 RepID=UPI00032EBA24|nr:MULTISPECIES: BppU family phage baseplate upper protein [Enterococcus]EOM08230.1 parallel beta-helix [Enterococcus faecium EnGen0260]EOM09167.1 parallel beta-helix [Enterococcus faecium EnGen0261]MDT2626009.1 BppU family phage baseplate upper protein [Enterococcus hirae]